MATPVVLDHSFSTGAGTPVSTGSVTPTVGRLLLAAIQSASRSSVTPGTPSVSGLSGTWTSPASIAYDSSGTGQARVDVFRCSDYSGSGALSISYASGTPDDVAWAIIEVAEVNLSAGPSNNGIVQTVTGSGATANPSVSLAALASPLSIAIGILGSEAGQATNPITPGGSFTQLALDGQDNAGGSAWIETEWATNQTTVNWTRSGTNSWGAIALEVASAARYPSSFAAIPFQARGRNL